jgi:hypothetical protein
MPLSELEPCVQRLDAALQREHTCTTRCGARCSPILQCVEVSTKQL